MKKQQIIFFIGCDNSGKTTIAKELSTQLNIPYFKNFQETNAFKKNYIEALNYEASIMFEFLKQTKYSIIRDREFPCEYVYSSVFNRKTDKNFIWKIDNNYAKLNAKLIYCYKSKYLNFNDKFVDYTQIEKIKEKYIEYLFKTKMKVLKLNTTDENLENQIKQIKSFLGE